MTKTQTKPTPVVGTTKTEAKTEAKAITGTTETTKGELCAFKGVQFKSPGGVLVCGTKTNCQWPDLTGRPAVTIYANPDGSGALFTPHSKGLKVWVYTKGLSTI